MRGDWDIEIEGKKIRVDDWGIDGMIFWDTPYEKYPIDIRDFFNTGFYTQDMYVYTDTLFKKYDDEMEYEVNIYHKVIFLDRKDAIEYAYYRIGKFLKGVENE